MAFSTHDQVPDSPTNVFATWNNLDTSATLSDGNLRVVTGNEKTFSTIFLPKLAGKFHVEYYVESMGETFFGVYNHTTGTHSVFYSTNQPNESIKIKSTNTGNTFTVTTGDTVGILVDTTNETIQWFKNGGSTSSDISSSYTLDDLANNDYSFYITHASTSGTSTIRINFGQDPTFGGNKNTPATVNSVTGPFAPSGTAAGTAGLFYYPPPADALALCTANLPDPDIDPAVDDLPEDYMKVKTYNGNSSTNNITGVGFKPDLVWIKRRTGTYVARHCWFDTVRGTDNNGSTSPCIFSNTTEAQYSKALASFDSDGFTLSSYDNGQEPNDATGGATYVAWCWKAGGAPSGSTSTTGSAKRINTSGTQDDTSCSALASAASASITPTLMSINQKAGFSIVKYTGNTTSGATIPHGLTKRPDLIFFKNTNTTNNWIVYNFLTTDSQFILKLNLTDQGNSAANTASWYATNSYFKTEQYNDTNGSGPIIAYCWHSVPGYSAFGSYTGNGSADGPFVYTGFKPAVIITKNVDSATNWEIYDSTRDPYNPLGYRIFPNSSSNETNESSTEPFDFLSNGFKLRTTASGKNANTIIYAAFAETPFKYANAR